jgi:hypothetical protein
MNGSDCSLADISHRKLVSCGETFDLITSADRSQKVENPMFNRLGEPYAKYLVAQIKVLVEERANDYTRADQL